MTQEEKDLLLKDLCARLPYGFIVHRYSDNCDITFKQNELDEFAHFLEYSEGEIFKPYLRPMSDMTFEEACKYIQYKNRERGKTTITIQNPNYTEGCGLPKSITMKTPEIKSDFINFLIANHLDVNGLIPMGLAIAVTEKNNPYKKK